MPPVKAATHYHSLLSNAPTSATLSRVCPPFDFLLIFRRYLIAEKSIRVSPMALAGRFRSSFSLIGRALRVESALGQRLAPQLGFRNPSTTSSETPRNYASATDSKEIKVKVPLSLFGLSGNYATALFISASKANVLEKVESEVLNLIEASKKSPVFSQFIKDLSVPVETRVKAVQEIASDAGFTDITKNFLAIMAENGRLRYMENIAKKFVRLTMAHRGEVKVSVVTVIPLPPEEEKELKVTLQELIGQGKTVLLEQKIDPSILGGLVIEFDQKVFDMSIKTRASQMEKFLREPVNFHSIQ